MTVNSPWESATQPQPPIPLLIRQHRHPPNPLRSLPRLPQDPFRKTLPRTKYAITAFPRKYALTVAPSALERKGT